MAIIPTEKKIESQHWYHANGDSCHQIEQKNGKMRHANLADARKLGLFPSVTGILGIFAKPQLDTWKQKEVAKACLRIKTIKGEDEDSYANRAINEAFEQVDEAADFGTRVHQAIEDWIVKGKKWGKEFEVYLRPVADWFEKTKILVTASELRLVNIGVGYAGTMDVAFVYGAHSEAALNAIKLGDQKTLQDLWNLGLGIGVLDFKTKKTKPGVAVTAFPFQDMQIAAYGGTNWSQAIGLPEETVLSRMIGANLYISSTEPGRFEVVKYPAEQLLGCWRPFTQACEIWRYIKKYDPRGAAEALGKVVEEKPPFDVDSPTQEKESIDTSDVDKIFKEGDNKRKASKAKGNKGEAKTTPKKSRSVYDTFVFPSGKWKGKHLNEVDQDYLSKVLTSKQFETLRKSTRGLVKALEEALTSK